MEKEKEAKAPKEEDYVRRHFDDDAERIRRFQEMKERILTLTPFRPSVII